MIIRFVVKLYIIMLLLKLCCVTATRTHFSYEYTIIVMCTGQNTAFMHAWQAFTTADAYCIYSMLFFWCK